MCNRSCFPRATTIAYMEKKKKCIIQTPFANGLEHLWEFDVSDNDDGIHFNHMSTNCSNTLAKNAYRHANCGYLYNTCLSARRAVYETNREKIWKTSNKSQFEITANIFSLIDCVGCENAHFLHLIGLAFPFLMFAFNWAEEKRKLQQINRNTFE